MSYRTLLLERTGHVATLTLNRPDRMNAFDSIMREELPAAWAEIARDEQIWAVILTGAGERAFCAGMDLREQLPERKGGALPRVHLTPMDCKVGKPVISAVNGVCAGGGIAFVSDADIVLCSDQAYFTDARTSAGQVSIHGTLRLARKIPLEAVLRLVLLGKAERLTAQRAFEIGLASEVVPAAQLMTRARALAEAIVENSPSAVFRSKDAIWDSLNHGLDASLERGWEVVTRFARESGDAKEGAQAFVEKRKPRWVYAPPPGQKEC
ncbi:MAG TPA: enoyl-CoA hydratase-related protein [Myxococcaceae bacterium]|nr:enoyl-CoA hydratase-related protein [Myxococcaceae bacterium]